MSSLSFLPFGLCVFYTCVFASFELTHFKLKIYDDNYATIEKSHIQAVNRSFKLYDLHLKILQLPIHTAKLRWALLKRSNGYLPYKFNYTVDICGFFKNSNHLLNNFIYSMVKDYTNVNHSCPYNHDIRVTNFPTRLFANLDLLTMPKGDYAIESTWYTNGKPRGEGTIKFTYF